jgi:ATP/maltotriose-dependent transcriptional regulator MalT
LAALLNQFGWLSIRLGRLAEAQSALERSCELFEQWQSAPLPGLGTDPLATLATLANVRGDYAKARQLGAAAQQRNERRGDPFNVTLALYALTNAAYGQGHYQHAHAYAQQAYKLTQETDNRWFMAYVRNDLGAIARTLGDYVQAEHHFQASYAIREAFADPEGMALALGQLGKLAIVQRHYAAAAESLQQSLALYREINDQGGQALALAGLGQVALAGADHQTAQATLQQALQIAAEIQFMPLVLALFTDIGRLLWQSGQRTQGIELLVLAGQHPASDGETVTRARQLLAEYTPQLAPEVVNPAKADVHAPDLADLISRLLLLLSLPMASTMTSTMAPPMAPDKPSATPVADPPRAAVAPQPATAALVEPLSEREIEVLHLIAAGLQNREIAEKMTVTVSTVKTHINNIYRKLDVTNRVQALAKARALHLL